MESVKAELRKAEDYMSLGDRDAAKAVIEDLFERFPYERSLYGAAANIYLAGKMFEEAKQVFTLYKNRLGKDLPADFSLDEITREQNERESAARSYESREVKVFKRMSAWERGRVSRSALANLSSIFPVKEIRISPTEIVLKKQNRDYHFAWSEIQDAFITKRKGYKGARFSEPFIKTLHIKTKDLTFEIDVSEIYPDFKHSDLLLKELQKRIPLREDKS
jgi:hypothetical protein